MTEKHSPYSLFTVAEQETTSSTNIDLTGTMLLVSISKAEIRTLRSEGGRFVNFSEILAELAITWAPLGVFNMLLFLGSLEVEVEETTYRENTEESFVYTKITILDEKGNKILKLSHDPNHGIASQWAITDVSLKKNDATPIS
jgi:hypothetical protein